MHRLPAQFTPGFLAAQLLVHRAATSPVTEFGGNCIGGNNLRSVIAQTKSLRDRPRDAANRQTRNRRADVTHARFPFEREHVEIGKILAMDQRPAHVLVTDHADCPPLCEPRRRTERTRRLPARTPWPDGMTIRRDAFTFKDALQMRNHPGERRQRAKRRLFVRNIVAGGAEQTSSRRYK